MGEHFSYRLHGGEIHEFHLKTATTEAVTDWLTCMSEILERGQPMQRVLIVLPEDFLPPVRYSLREIRLWMQRYPHKIAHIDTAVLLPYGKGLRSIVQTFNHTLTRGRSSRVEFFFHNEYERARDWLIEKA